MAEVEEATESSDFEDESAWAKKNAAPATDSPALANTVPPASRRGLLSHLVVTFSAVSCADGPSVPAASAPPPRLSPPIDPPPPAAAISPPAQPRPAAPAPAAPRREPLPSALTAENLLGDHSSPKAEAPKKAEDDFFSDMGMGINYQAAPTLVAKKPAPAPASTQPQPSSAASNKYAVDSLLPLQPAGGGWAADSDLGLDLDLVTACLLFAQLLLG